MVMKKLFMWTITLAGFAILMGVASVVIKSQDMIKWSQAKGHVIASALVISKVPKYVGLNSSFTKVYGADVEYVYTVDGGEYQSNRVTFRDKDGLNLKDALKLMNKYRHQHAVTVYYNRVDPQQAILDPYNIGDISIPLMVGGLLAVLGLFGLYYQSLEVNLVGVENFQRQGLAYQRKRKLSLALSEFNKIIESSPGLAIGYIRRGDLYLEQEEWDNAIADFNLAISIAPDNGYVYFSRANAYLGKKQLDLAWADMLKAVENGYKVKSEILESLHMKLYQRQL
jgi:tetratricopeptide (TPR) repeat protein